MKILSLIILVCFYITNVSLVHHCRLFLFPSLDLLMKKFGIIPLEKDVWRKLVIARVRKEHNIKPFKSRFMINRLGNICMCGNDGTVYRKYWHNNQWYVDIYANGVHINQTVKTLIKNSWGAEAAAEYAELLVA